MTTYTIYTIGAVLLFAVGLHGVCTSGQLVRLIIALNVTSAGVFLALIAVASRPAEEMSADPVPQALVLTGIVVAVSISALALALARRIHATTGRIVLSEEDLE